MERRLWLPAEGLDGDALPIGCHGMKHPARKALQLEIAIKMPTLPDLPWSALLDVVFDQYPMARLDMQAPDMGDGLNPERRRHAEDAARQFLGPLDGRAIGTHLDDIETVEFNIVMGGIGQRVTAIDIASIAVFPAVADDPAALVEPVEAEAVTMLVGRCVIGTHQEDHRGGIGWHPPGRTKHRIA